MRCRVCEEKMILREVIHDCRADGGKRLLKSKPYSLKKQNVSLYECPYCSHMQIEYLLPEDFYEDYEDGSGALQYYGELSLTNKKLESLSRYAASPDSLIEIGCGAGHDLIQAQKYFSECFGVDPSASECKVAKSAGLDIQCGYFDKSLSLKRNFSAFCSFQVFEHLEDLYSALDYAYEILVENGVGLINVPNGQAIVQNGAWHQVLLEHINYFTPFSLAFAAKKAGFQILSINAIAETMEMDLYVQKPGQRNMMDLIRAKQKEKLDGYLNDCKSLTLFGAGAKAHIYSSLFLGKEVKHIVDSDITKKGRYVAGLPLPVEPASKELMQQSDVVVILASSYNRQIVKELREQYDYKGKIICFIGENIQEVSAPEDIVN